MKTSTTELVVFLPMKKKENYVDVNWITATEINNNYFTLERSATGINFEPIGYVQGAGNSTSTINYVFKDRDPLNGIGYYRLKQTDFDLEWHLSVQFSPIKQGPLQNTFIGCKVSIDKKF